MFPERRGKGVLCEVIASVSPPVKWEWAGMGVSFTQKIWVIQRPSRGSSSPLILEGSSWSNAGDGGPEREGQAR